MNMDSFRFTVGHFDCFAISDGALNYPIESLFANVPRTEVEASLRQQHLPTTHVTTPYTCLLVTTGRHRVLIDTGAGPSLGVHAAQMFPGIDQSTTVTGTLQANLRALGLQPSEIDTIVITHAHPDHVGGTLDEDGELRFPDAHYFVARSEWEFWVSDAAAAAAPAAMVSIAWHNLRALEPQLTLIDDGAEIVPGMTALATPGHTPGHLALAIASAGELLLHVSDTVLYPLHLEHPDWVPVFDLLPEQAASSKQWIFDRAATEDALVFAHHFPPFPNLGHVRARARGWQWEPLV